MPIPVDRISSYFTITAYHSDFRFVERDGEFFPDQKLTQIPVVPCKDLPPAVDHALYSYWQSDKKAVLMKKSNGYCLNPPKDLFFVQGKPTEERFAMVGVYVLPCSQATGCAPASEVTQMNINIVEIETKESAKPSKKWLDMAKTSLARRHIRSELGLPAVGK